MKRAAGHNKTHISGLESFLISPDAVAQALKLKLGCTTAALKLPGNNVKEHEVLLQGHCVNEVVEHLASVYAIDKKWIVLPKKN
jgi:translation initiation factor 2D